MIVSITVVLTSPRLPAGAPFYCTLSPVARRPHRVERAGLRQAAISLVPAHAVRPEPEGAGSSRFVSLHNVVRLIPSAAAHSVGRRIHRTPPASDVDAAITRAPAGASLVKPCEQPCDGGLGTAGETLSAAATFSAWRRGAFSQVRDR
jgi:hypothetical protein